MKNRPVKVSPTNRWLVRPLLLVIVFGVAFSVMIPAQAETTVGTSFGDTTSLEVGPTMGSVEVDDVREVPLMVIVVALASSVGLLLSSLGPKGLTVLTTIGHRGR